MADEGTAVVHAIEVSGLRFSYRKTKALSGVSLEVAERSIHGFVGPNGAGKTTTLKILATLLKPQGGTVRIYDMDVVHDYKKVRRLLGYMPDHLGLYREMTVFECLDFFAAAYGMNLASRTSVINDVLELTDMAGRAKDLVSSLSRGMLQRVSLARALVHDPDILLLDEPASGLDPRGRIELMEILKELRKLGKTIFISSHILSELADLCDSVTIIDRGWTRHSGPMRELLKRSAGVATYLIGLQADCPPVHAALQAIDGVGEVTPVEGQVAYRVTMDAARVDTNALLRVVIDAGGTVVSFKEDTRELAEAFMELTEPGVPS